MLSVPFHPIKSLGFGGLVSYGPNYYPVHAPLHPYHLVPHPRRADDTVRVGCFGAIRPLKNHVTQAIAAIAYAQAVGKKLEFHVNATRIEGGGNPILANLIAMFAATPRAKLVQIGWLEHAAFIDLLFGIDICLQVSFSETFNIVSADAVAASCPVVASREVSWLQSYAIADPTSSTSIMQRMLQINQQPQIGRLAWQWRDLTKYCETTRKVWKARFA
jgi:glycosyltransferase involved in cell wall biosynthesis